MRHPVACAVAVVLTLAIAARAAAADDVVYIKTEVETRLCRLDDLTKCRDLPPGRFVSEAPFAVLDDEVRRLQAAEIRLKAENASLRRAVKGWQPGWRTLLAVLGTGLAGGAYLAYGR